MCVRSLCNMLHTYYLSVPHAAAAETMVLVLRARPPFMVLVLRAPPPPLLNDGRVAIPMHPRPTAALNARTGPLSERNFAIAGGLDGAFTMIHVRVDADAVIGFYRRTGRNCVRKPGSRRSPAWRR